MLRKRGQIFLHTTAILDSEIDGCSAPTIGAGTRVWAFAHIRSKARIGENCSIAKGASIEGILGDRVRVQNGVSVFEGVVIESDVFIGPHTVFTNDRMPRLGEPWQVEATLVRHHASIGAGVTVRCGITIGEYALVGAGSVVTTNVLPFTIVRGNPARPVGFVCRHGHKMRAKDLCSFVCERCGDGLDVELRYFRAGGGDTEHYPRRVADPR